MNSALSKAINGEKVPDKQAKGALADAVGKLKNLGGRISKAKEKSEAVADAVIATAEMQGAAFGASFAEGYFGEEKMDIGPVDLRVGGGLLVGGYGLYQSMTGKGGSHSLAIGNGLLAIGLGRVGRNAGKALAEKRDKKGQEQPQGAAAVAPPPPAQLPSAQGDFGDLVRDIFLTPNASGAEPVDRAAPERHRPSRFIRAS
jgi:hypothetical protein